MRATSQDDPATSPNSRLMDLHSVILLGQNELISWRTGKSLKIGTKNLASLLCSKFFTLSRHQSSGGHPCHISVQETHEVQFPSVIVFAFHYNGMSCFQYSWNIPLQPNFSIWPSAHMASLLPRLCNYTSRCVQNTCSVHNLGGCWWSSHSLQASFPLLHQLHHPQLHWHRCPKDKKPVK